MQIESGELKMSKSRSIEKIWWSCTGLAILVAVILVASSNAAAQTDLDLEWAAKQIEVSRAVSREEKRALSAKLLERLSSTPSPGMDQRELVHFLKLQEAYLAIDPDGLSRRLNEVTAATSVEQKREALIEIRYELLQRAGNLAQVLTPNNSTREDASNLLSALVVASKAADDVRDPSVFGGKASGITSLLNRANTLSNFAGAIQDPDAKRVVSSFRGTIGEIQGKLAHLGVSMPNPIKAFDLAFDGTASYMQVTREGLLQSTEAMKTVTAAIEGDPNAERRLPEQLSKLGNTLSQQNYGRAMANSMLDRLVDRIPFVRSLAKWTAPKPTGIPGINRFLTMRVDCPGAARARVEITQFEDRVKAVIADSVLGCLNKGEILFEGDYIGEKAYRVQIYEIWKGTRERRVMNGKVVVQISNFVRVESALIDSPSHNFYLSL